MRTLLVVLAAEVVEAPLLADEIRPGGASRLVLEGAMEALMPSVLLRVARLDQLGRDTEPDPPHREPRDPPDRLAGERRTVVAADDRGSPYSRKARSRALRTPSWLGLVRPLQ